MKDVHECSIDFNLPLDKIKEKMKEIGLDPTEENIDKILFELKEKMQSSAMVSFWVELINFDKLRKYC